MSEDVINANPTVIDISDLPTRLGSQILDGKPHNEFLQDLSSLSLTSGISDAELSDDMDTDDEGIIDHEQCEEIDAQEIFDLLATMSDPEHPLTLAQLAIVNLPDIKVKNGNDQELSEVLVKITPTITHCSLATLIGLGIRVRLERCLPPRFRIRILLKEGTHQSENQVNKQLNDKERVAAACENDQLLGVILQMLSTCK